MTEATRWRLWSGQALSEYSTVGRESMAERVCSLDKSLQTSGIQAGGMVSTGDWFRIYDGIAVNNKEPVNKLMLERIL